MSDTLKLGNLVSPNNYGKKDAVHIAVAAVEANQNLEPGDHVGLLADGKAANITKSIGIVDPFLKQAVRRGDKFWLYLYPGSITSLEHKWTHPAFTEIEEVKSKISLSTSEIWMRKWASEHMSYDYYGDGNLTEDASYRKAIDAGHNMSVGPYESARDYIDDVWWGNWEIITGCKRPAEGERYFSCGC